MNLISKESLYSSFTMFKLSIGGFHYIVLLQIFYESCDDLSSFLTILRISSELSNLYSAATCVSWIYLVFVVFSLLFKQFSFKSFQFFQARMYKFETLFPSKNSKYS